jgi:hypothetical protein
MANRFFKSRGLGVLNTSYAAGAAAVPNPGDVIPDASTILSIWYDAATNEYFQPSNPTTGGTITQWNDRSAFAHNLNPSGTGPTRRPTWNDNQQNSLGTLAFSGNDSCDTAPATWLQSLPGSTVFFVSKFDNGSSGTVQNLIMTDQGDLGVVKDATNTLKIYQQTGQAGESVGTTLFSPGNDYRLITLVYNGTEVSSDNRIKLRVNGDDISTVWSGAPIATTLSAASNKFFVGSDYTGAADTSQLVGAMAELVFYSRTLTPSEITTTEAYFNDKWNLY